jgi:trehalose 6-phosphate synthase/phosphatase
MVAFADLKDLSITQGYNIIIAADGEPVSSVIKKDGVVAQVPAGGVAMVLDPIAKATNATYIARAKKDEERIPLDKNDKMMVGNADGNYILKRLFINEEDLEGYYFGFANQTLWPLCHVAFEEPQFHAEWFEQYKRVNQVYADSIKAEIKGKSLVWIHDYQLAMVPSMLNHPKDTIIGMFWHIPWPTWEVFRVLPYKKEILTSMLASDFLAFHRNYQARNFLDTVERELEARIDQETQQVHYNNHVTTVRSLPLGLDIDVVKSMVHVQEEETPLSKTIRDLFGIEEKKEHPLQWYFEKYKVIFGVDRLDYTKGIRQRLQALDAFFERNPQYIGKVVYLGIIAPSREKIASYKKVRKEAKELEASINAKYGTKNWKPLHLLHVLFNREDILNFYHSADICLVTPLDDGMNLVSKEFVVASSMSTDPGMLVLSQFAGSATDLTGAIIVNPYDKVDVADGIKEALEMKPAEKKTRINSMAEMLEEKNVYDWGYTFIRDAIQSAKLGLARD